MKRPAKVIKMDQHCKVVLSSDSNTTKYMGFDMLQNCSKVKGI